MTRFIQKIGHEKANLYASISTLVGVLALLISIFGYIWYDAKYKSDTANDIKNIKTYVFALDTTARGMSDKLYNYDKEILNLKENCKKLDVKKQNKKSISPEDLPITYINIPKKDSINYLSILNF